MYAGFLLLAPALGLTAFACLPTMARAETSSEKVYHLGPPGLESEGVEATPKAAPTKNRPKPKRTPEAHNTATPKTGEKGPADTTTGSEGEAASKERHEAHAATPGGNDHPPGGGHGQRKGGAPKPSADSGHTGTRQLVRTPTKVDSSESGGGGGSSPVVPILILVAVLAALSIGTVLYRGRRQDPRPEGYGRNSA
ncbi:MAG: hypothetical protein ACRDPE_13775 [Solirubrobacterales bacterium]